MKIKKWLAYIVIASFMFTVLLPLNAMADNSPLTNLKMTSPTGTSMAYVGDEVFELNIAVSNPKSLAFRNLAFTMKFDQTKVKMVTDATGEKEVTTASLTAKEKNALLDYGDLRDNGYNFVYFSTAEIDDGKVAIAIGITEGFVTYDTDDFKIMRFYFKVVAPGDPDIHLIEDKSNAGEGFLICVNDDNYTEGPIGLENALDFGKKSNAELNSKLNFVVTAPVLDVPTNVTLTDKVASWTGVDNNNGYTVNLYDSGSLAYSEDTAQDITSLDLSSQMTAGSYTVTVIAKGDSIYDDSAESAPSAVQEVKETLAAPTNVTLVDKVASWTAVTNNSGYTVNLYMKGVSGVYYTEDTDTTETTLDLTARMAGPGEYSVKVIAKGTGVYNSSPESAEAVQDIPYPFAISDGAINKTGGISASAKVTPSAGGQQAVIIYQLMKDTNTVVDLVAVEGNFTVAQTYTAQFPSYAGDNYWVKVFVWDQLENSTTYTGINLAPGVAIK